MSEEVAGVIENMKGRVGPLFIGGESSSNC